MRGSLKLEIERAVRRACMDYASGLNTGPVKTRPDRRAKAIQDGVEALEAIFKAGTK